VGRWIPTDKTARDANRRAKSITIEHILLAIALIIGVLILAPLVFNALLITILLLISGCFFAAFARFQLQERVNRGRWMHPLRDMTMKDFARLLWSGFTLFMNMMADLVSMFTQNQSHTSTPAAPRHQPRPQPAAQATFTRVPQASSEPPAEDMSHLPNGELAFQHALQAGRNAGLDVHSRVLPVDIGLMVFTRGERAINRTDPPPDNAEYVQPFIVLHLLQRASGRVRFEIIDSDGQRLFVHEGVQNLGLGANLISPAARLKILDAHNFDGEWQLRVSADGVPLAAHHFAWHESREKLVRRHLTADGELRADAREQLVSEDPFDRITLDDLLSEQPAQRRGSSH